MKQVKSIKISKEETNKIKTLRLRNGAIREMAQMIVEHLTAIQTEVWLKEKEAWEELFEKYKVTEVLPPEKGKDYNINFPNTEIILVPTEKPKSKIVIGD